MMLKTLVIFFIIFWNAISSPLFSEGINEWQYITEGPFIVYFQNHDAKNARNVLNTLITSYEQLAADIGIELQGNVNIFITPSQEVFQQFAGKNIPRWSDGIAEPSRNMIVLKSPRWVPDLNNNHKIAIHELTHILLNQAVKGYPIPRWLNEGMAVYYSGEKAYASSTLVSKALITKSIISLSHIDEVLEFHREKAQLAYQESYLAVTFLFKKFGEDKVREIIRALGEGKDINQAMLETIHMEFTDFEIAWYKYIQKKFRWHFLMEFDTYLWIFMVALFILGFLLMRRRNKRTIQRWQEEDEFEGPW